MRCRLHRAGLTSLCCCVEEARDVARLLKTFPKRGRVVPEINDQDIRELFVRSYRLIYEIRDKGIVILAFIHGARRFPSNLT